jgi:hypothetical protein
LILEQVFNDLILVQVDPGTSSKWENCLD